MPDTPVLNRGAQLLVEWRGGWTQLQAAEKLKLDPATYNRFEHGVRRPKAEVGFEIEQLTDGKVPAKSWFDPPVETSKARAS